MKTSSVSGLALAATSMFSSFASAVQFLSVDGANFVTNATGERFTMIGVDYQPGGSSGLTKTSDPLSDADKCLRDAIMLQNLGVNLIRVYNLDVDLNHDACASIFNAAGIYMLLDVNAGDYGTYIDRTAPWTTYTTDYLKHVFGIMEAFAYYPNLLGFFAGNEIINEESIVNAPMYIRAVVRDMKDYIAANFDRSIGVGYSAADVADMLEDTWNYLGCDLSNETSSKIDFFGLNDYEWCGDSSYTDSGYDKLVSMFGDTAIPVFFSEYGCNNVKPRTFTNVPVLYGDKMTALSGGLVYEYSEGANDYGLVNIKSADEITLREDYNFLAAQYAKLDVKTLQTANKTATGKSATECSASLITGSAFYNSWELPARPDGAADIISNGLPNPNQGKLVDVSKTAMPATVYNSTGEKVEGLKLTILDSDASNYPGLIDGYTATAGAGKATATSSKKSSSSSGSGSGSGSSSSTSTSTSASGSGSGSDSKDSSSKSTSNESSAASRSVALSTGVPSSSSSHPGSGSVGTGAGTGSLQSATGSGSLQSAAVTKSPHSGSSAASSRATTTGSSGSSGSDDDSSTSSGAGATASAEAVVTSVSAAEAVVTSASASASAFSSSAAGARSLVSGGLLVGAFAASVLLL